METRPSYEWVAYICSSTALLQTLINTQYINLNAVYHWSNVSALLMTGCVHAWRKTLKEGPGYRGQYWVKLCRFVNGPIGFCAAPVNIFIGRWVVENVECSTWLRNPWRSWWSRGAGTAKETTSQSSCSRRRWSLSCHLSQWVSPTLHNRMSQMVCGLLQT